MNIVIGSLKNNTALIAILLIDLMLAIWSCERETAKISNPLEKDSSKKVVYLNKSNPGLDFLI